MSLKSALAALFVLVAAALFGFTAPAPARAAAGQGKALFTQHCTRCHGTEVMHPGRKVDSLAALRRQVTHCNHATQAGLSKAQQAAVVRYLNDQFYHFPTPSR